MLKLLVGLLLACSVNVFSQDTQTRPSTGFVKPSITIMAWKTSSKLPDSLLLYGSTNFGIPLKSCWTKIQAKDNNVLYGLGGTVPTRDHQFAKALNASAITDSGSRGVCVPITAQPFSDSMWVRLIATHMDTLNNLRPYMIVHAMTNYILVKKVAAFSAETNASTDTAYTPYNGSVLYQGSSTSKYQYDVIKNFKFVLDDSTKAAEIDVTVGVK